MASSFPALDIKPPEIQSPLTTLGSIAQMRAFQMENLLRQQQIAQSQAQTADIQSQSMLRQRQLQSQQRLNAALANPANYKALANGDYSPIFGAQADPQQTAAAVKMIDESRAAHVNLTDAQIKQRREGLSEAAQMIRDTPDDADPETIKAQFNEFGKVGGEYSKIAQSALQAFDQIPGDVKTKLDGMERLANFHSQLIDAQLAKQKATDEAQLPGAQVAEAQARAQEAAASARKTGLEADLLANPQQGLAALDTILGPNSTLSAGLKAEYSAAPTAEARAAVLSKATGLMGEKDPQMQAARARQALLTAQTTLPVRQADASYQNSLQQGDKASADYFSSLKDAKQALATAHTIQTVLDLSKQTGNPVAMQQLKTMVPEFTNAAQQIKRLSGGQNAGLSSALDNAINELTSAGGKPLSDSTMAAISPYVKTIANGAIQQHNATVAGLSQAYPQKQFAPEPVPYPQVAGHFVGEKVNLKNGKQGTISVIHPDGSFDIQ